MSLSLTDLEFCMSVLPSMIGAVAASLAAILAGLTLYVSGRRDNRKWLRDALIDAYVEFLDASFRAPNASGYELRSSNNNAPGLVAMRALRHTPPTRASPGVGGPAAAPASAHAAPHLRHDHARRRSRPA